MKSFRKVVLAVVIVCLLPFAAALLANLFGYAASCAVDFGVTQACSVAGIEIGPALQALGSLSYATFFTVPLLILTLIAWGLVELVHRLRGRATG
ncbi:MAG: hypothetical protein WC829_20210 [Hyphomicrobium sp.]